MRDDFGYGDSPFPMLDGAGFGVVRSRYDANQIDEAFLSSDSVTSREALTAPAYVGLALSEKKLRAAFALMGLMLVAVMVRAADVQLVEGESYSQIAEGNRVRAVPMPVERGVMYDRFGTPLVRNVPDFSVTITPGDLPQDATERRIALDRLAVILQTDVSGIETTLAEYKGYESSPVTVAENVTHDQAVRVEIEHAATPAVALATGLRRDYVATGIAQTLSHVLGYEGRLTKDDLAALGPRSDYQPSDTAGKTGLEKQYEQLLRGTYGSKRVEVDATGREKKVIAEDDGSPGKNLVLTIDLPLQQKAEQLLKSQLKKAHKTRGSVIVMDPNNGDVLALVSEPSFDNNLFAKGISSADYAKLIQDPDHPMFPRAIAAEVASGSVFKPVVGAAAMQEGIINENTSVVSTGGVRIGAWFFPDWRAGGHGVTNLAKAIAESVNTFFYFVGGGLDGSGNGLGVERIVAYAKKFGFGSKLGIDLPGESNGFLPSKEWKEEVKGEKWYIGDTYHVAIGQGDIIVTPLQIAAMTAAFANRGTLVQPRMVSAVTTADGSREQLAPHVLNKDMVSSRSLEAVRKGMRQTVTSGSGRLLNDLPVQVAGKTGTAQWNSKKDNHAWFTSFGPYDKPQIVVTVMIEEGIEGSRTASPIAKEIYRWYFGGRE